MDKLALNSKKKLNNGTEISVIGLGVWKSAAGAEVENAVKWALEAGYRHIDTAKIYGNEEGVGKAVRESGIDRAEIFITTKLWNEDQGYDSALKAIDASLNRLGMDYVDLYLVHWPFFNYEERSNRRKDTWKAMEEIYASGKAKAIGVSNYTIKHLEEMKGYMKTPPAVNQFELHPFWYRQELLDYCQKHDIAVEGYSPLVRGQMLNDDRITVIANKYGKTNAQILLRWSLQHGCVPLPKSVHQDRIRQNIEIFDFELTDGDVKALDGLNQNFQVVDWDMRLIP